MRFDEEHRISFNSSARRIGAGNPNTILSPLIQKVLRKSRQKINILKKKFKLLQADPGTVQYPQRWPVILEGNDNPIHGFVGK